MTDVSDPRAHAMQHRLQSWVKVFHAQARPAVSQAGGRLTAGRQSQTKLSDHNTATAATNPRNSQELRGKVVVKPLLQLRHREVVDRELRSSQHALVVTCHLLRQDERKARLDRSLGCNAVRLVVGLADNYPEQQAAAEG